MNYCMKIAWHMVDAHPTVLIFTSLIHLCLFFLAISDFITGISFVNSISLALQFESTFLREKPKLNALLPLLHVPMFDI